MAERLKLLTRCGLAGLVVVSAASPLQARPDARAMACAEVQALLAREGAVTFTTGANTFERYVRPGTCDGTRVARPASVATRDAAQCAVHVCGRRVERQQD